MLSAPPQFPPEQWGSGRCLLHAVWLSGRWPVQPSVTELEERHPPSSPHKSPLPPSSNKGNGSVMMLGGVDHSYYRGELQWVPVSAQQFWQVTMDR